MNVHSQSWVAVALASVMLASMTVALGPAQAESSLESGTLPGNGFVSAKVNWNGEHTLGLWMTYPNGFSPPASGAAVIKPDGSSWGVIGIGSSFAGNHDCVVFSSEATGSVADSCNPGVAQATIRGIINNSGSFAIQLDPGSDAPGTYTLLNWQAYRLGEQKPASWEIRSTSGDATIVGVKTGTSAYYAIPADFQGGTRVSVGAANAFADANSGSHYTMSVRNAPMAWMAPDKLGGVTSGMMLHSPVGSVQCECSFALTGPRAGVPGTYDVQLDRVAAGLQSEMEAFVALVDPEFP